MRRESVLAIWFGGLVLAVALYLVGPDRFFDALLNLADAIDAAFRELVATLGAQTYSAVRALAIALYVVFAVLALLASQRGRGGMGALVVITGVFLILVWRPFGVYGVPISRWMAALVLVAVGGAVMTQRLTTATFRQEPPPPYPPGGRLP